MKNRPHIDTTDNFLMTLNEAIECKSIASCHGRCLLYHFCLQLSSSPFFSSPLILFLFHPYPLQLSSLFLSFRFPVNPYHLLSSSALIPSFLFFLSFIPNPHEKLFVEHLFSVICDIKIRKEGRGKKRFEERDVLIVIPE